MTTPRTEMVAQRCSTDGEYSDVQAYNEMYRHATNLEKELNRYIEYVKSVRQNHRRYMWIRQGKKLEIVVPHPTEKKPDGKIIIICNQHPEAAYGESLDKAIDAQLVQ